MPVAKNSTFTIRPVRPDDIPSVAEIYGEAVRSGTASFELAVPDANEMERRRAALVNRGYPYLVCELADGKIAGYAYAGAYRERPAYRFTVEDSIYLAPGFRGQGYGRLLLSELIHYSTSLGFRQMVAIIGDTNNHGSIALHRACGFVMTGTFRDVGWKFDNWLDSVMMQRALGAGAETAGDDGALPALLVRKS